MNICLYSNVFLPAIGGIEASSLNLASAWTALGHHVLLITNTPAPADFDRQFPFPVVRSPDPARWRDLLKDRHILVSNGYSLAHLRAWRRARIPFGWIHAMSYHPDNFSFLGRLKQRTRHLAGRLAHFNVCVSESVKRNIGNFRAVVIPNAVSPIFRPLPGIAPSGRFLYYGRIWMLKGIDTLLQALALLRQSGLDCPLDLVGTGEDLVAAQALAASLKVADLAHFHPAQQGEQLVQTINAARAVIVPSHCQEAFGLTAAEAFACGQCVVASLDGGLPEVVGTAALTFPPADAPALAAHLRSLMEHAEIATEYRARALARAPEFSRDRIALEYIEFFKSIIIRAGWPQQIGMGQGSPPEARRTRGV